MFGINPSDRKKWTSKKTKPDRRYKILRRYRSKWRRYISGGNDKRWRKSFWLINAKWIANAVKKIRQKIKK